jgi:transposase-like protein
MDTPSPLPTTLVEAIRYFSDPDTCLALMVSLRWPNGVTCPTCGRTDARFISTRRLWECKDKHPRRQFSVKVGTIFEDSPLGLDKWLPAIWMIANCKNGVSSHEMARSLGVTQKTAWFMLHRIRLAMQTGTFQKLSGEVEADETFIGGKFKNMHRDRRQKKAAGRGAVGKVVVMGLLERNGEARTFVVPNNRRHTMQAKVREHVQPGSNLYTDTLASYLGLAPEYLHEFVNHAHCYVRGRVYTNGLENFWSLLKRALKGTYVAVSPEHLFRYLDEQTFRFNNRRDEEGDGGRFRSVAGSVVNRRLTFAELTGKE